MCVCVCVHDCTKCAQSGPSRITGAGVLQHAERAVDFTVLCFGTITRNLYSKLLDLTHFAEFNVLTLYSV